MENAVRGCDKLCGLCGDRCGVVATTAKQRVAVERQHATGKLRGGTDRRRKRPAFTRFWMSFEAVRMQAPQGASLAICDSSYTRCCQLHTALHTCSMYAFVVFAAKDGEKNRGKTLWRQAPSLIVYVFRGEQP